MNAKLNGLKEDKRMKQKVNKMLLTIVATSLMALVISSCNKNQGSTQSDNSSSENSSSEQSTSSTYEEDDSYEEYQGPINIDVASFNETINLHSSIQNQYKSYLLEHPGEYDGITNFATGTEELSRPVSVHFSWSATCKYDIIDSYLLKISENNNMYGSLKYETKATQIDIFNLKINTTYYYTVSAIINQKRATSDIKSFVTETNGPRNIYIDGVTNIRDIGGYLTPDGYTKQGLLYRTGRFNKSDVSEPIIEVTQKGIDMAKNYLNIKSEIDLRLNNETGGITSSPLGEDVTYKHIPMAWQVESIINNNITGIRKIFNFMAEEDNYPMAFHCNIGTDRTGGISFLIEALLGVSIDDIYVDYVYSNFGNIGGTRSSSVINSYINLVKDFSGTTLQERVYNYLVSKNIARETLDSVKSILGPEK